MSNPILQEALTALKQPAMIIESERVQYPDVILKTAGLFILTVAAAAVGWVFLPANLFTILGLSIAALVVAVMAARQARPTAPLPMLYAVLEGLLVGAFSAMIGASYGNDIVVTAVVATGVVFAVCLGVFQIPAVRNSNQGRKFFIVAVVAYLILSVFSIIAGVFFGLGGGMGIFGLGAVGIIVSILATLLASWSLVIDFGDVDRAVKNGAPQEISWRLSLGILISTIWLYLEILRLLAITNR